MIMPTPSDWYGWEEEQFCDICGKSKPLSVFKKNAYQKRGKNKRKYKVKACYRCYYSALTKNLKKG